jgi:type II secretory pathway pseudopilin PulG
MKTPRAYIIMETIVAMIVLSILAGVLTTAIFHHQTATQHLSDIRSASRLAESSLISAQNGRPTTQPSEIQQLNSDAPAGFKWVMVQTSVNGHKSSLVGLLPEGTP